MVDRVVILGGGDGVQPVPHDLSKCNEIDPEKRPEEQIGTFAKELVNTVSLV